MNRRTCGLKTQSLIALLVSFSTAAAAFLIMDQVSSSVLNNYFETSTYISKKSSEYMDSFASYIAKNNIAASDSAAVNSWQNSGKKISTIIYINRDGKTLYDSLQFNWQSDTADNAESAVTASANAGSYEQDQYVGGNYGNNSWFYKRELAFSDGPATVSLYGYFDQWIYDAVLIGEILLSGATLCAVFICLLRRKINYVLQLEEEIKFLETGGLNFPISVKGHDELTSLADSLNQMRVALSENMEAEGDAVKTNYDLVAAVSHDLRTPLTSLALYLDLIHTGKYSTPEQFNAYLEKCRNKVSQIKQMSDQLFERFYLEKSTKKALEQPEYAQTVFEEGLSNMVGYVGENGFEVQASMEWPVQKVSVSSYYINRIFDNISSNLLKYADPAFPLTLEINHDKNFLQIAFSNRIRQLEEKPDSTEVGVENIQFMMDKMNGECFISQNCNTYLLRLRFRLEANETEVHQQ